MASPENRPDYKFANLVEKKTIPGALAAVTVGTLVPGLAVPAVGVIIGEGVQRYAAQSYKENILKNTKR